MDRERENGSQKDGGQSPGLVDGVSGPWSRTHGVVSKGDTVMGWINGGRDTLYSP
jgi:hypothetical protein